MLAAFHVISILLLAVISVASALIAYSLVMEQLFTYQSAQEEQFDILSPPVYYPPTSSIYGLAVRPIGGDKGVVVEYHSAQLTLYVRNLGSREVELQAVYVKDVETNTGITAPTKLQAR